MYLAERLRDAQVVEAAPGVGPEADGRPALPGRAIIMVDISQKEETVTINQPINRLRSYLAFSTTK